MASAVLSVSRLVLIEVKFQHQFSASVDALSFLADLAIPVSLNVFPIIAMVWIAIRRANPLAKWLGIVLVVTRILNLPTEWAGAAQSDASSLLWLSGFALIAYSVALLFRRDSARWFSTRGHPSEHYEQVFE